VPLVRPVTRIGLPAPLTDTPPQVAVYDVIVAPPLPAGALKLTLICALPAAALTLCGAPGTVAGVTIVVVVDVWSLREFVSPVVDTVAVNVLDTAFVATDPLTISAVSPDPAATAFVFVHEAVPGDTRLPHDHPALVLDAASVGEFNEEGMVRVTLMLAVVAAEPTFETVSDMEPVLPVDQVPGFRDTARSGPVIETRFNAELLVRLTSDEFESEVCTCAVAPYVSVGDPLTVIFG